MRADGVFFYFSGVAVCSEGGGVAHAGDTAAFASVEERALTQVAVEEGAGGLEPRREDAYRFFSGGKDAGFYRGVAQFFVAELVDGVATVVVDAPRERGRDYGVAVAHALADVAEVPRGIAFVEQPHLKVRAEAAVADGASADVADHAQAVHAVGLQAVVGLEVDDCLTEVVGENFVGVNREYIAVGGEACCELALRAVACEGARDYAATVVAAYFDSGVGGV